MLVPIMLCCSANAYLLVLLSFGLCNGMSFLEVLSRGLHRAPIIIRRRVDRSSSGVVLCSTDEFYDAYVESCSRCSDICRPNLPDLSLCVSKCRDYFLRHFNASWHPTPSLLVTPSSVAVHSPGGERDEVESLVNKPLFWTSIVSMTIATLATVAIIVLCIKRRKLLRSAVVSRPWTGQGRTENSKDHWSKSLNRTDGKPDESIGKNIESGHKSGFRKQQDPSKRRRDDCSFSESMPTPNAGNVDENYNARDHCRPKRTDHPTPTQDKGQTKGPMLATIASPSDSESSKKKAQTMDSDLADFQIQKAKQLSSSSTSSASSSVASVAKPRDSSKDAAESESKRVKSDDKDETNLKRCAVEKPDKNEYSCGPIRLPEDIGIKTVKNNSIASPAEILRMKIDIRDVREEVGLNEEDLNSNYGIFSLTEDELQSASLMR